MADENMLGKSKEEIQQEAREIAGERLEKVQSDNYGRIVPATDYLKKGIKVAKDIYKKATTEPEGQEIKFPTPKSPTPPPAPPAGTGNLFEMTVQERKDFLKAKKQTEQRTAIQEYANIMEEDQYNLKKPNANTVANGGNLFPLFDRSKQKGGDFVYYPYKGEDGYVLENYDSLDDARNAAFDYYDTLESTGATVVPQAYKETNSFIRRAAMSGGDPNEIRKLVADSNEARYERILDGFKKDPKYDGYSEENLMKMAYLKAVGPTFAIPQHVFDKMQFAGAFALGTTTKMVQGLDSWLDFTPMFDGILTGAWTHGLNGMQKMEELFSKNTDYRDGSVLLLDEDLNVADVADADVKSVSSKHPFLNIKPSELQKANKDSVAPNAKVRAIRLFSEDFLFSLGVVTGVGKMGAKYYDELADQAVRNIKKKFKDKTITSRMIYNEAKQIRTAQYENMYKDTKKTWGAKIKNYIGGELVDYNYSPYRYSGSLAVTEGVMSGGMAYGEYLARKIHTGYNIRPGADGSGAGIYEVMGGVAGGITSMLAASTTHKLGKKALLAGTKGTLGLINLAEGVASIDPTKTVPQILRYMNMEPKELEAILRKSNPLLDSDLIKDKPQLEKAARQFLTRHIEYSKKDPTGAALYLKAMERNQALVEEGVQLGLFRPEEMFLTLGAMAESDVIKAAEYTADQMKAGYLKTDKNFKFINQAALVQKRTDTQTIIDRALSRLDSANLDEASELFKFRDALKSHSVKFAGETAELETFIRNSLIYDSFKLYDGVEMATTTASKMDELLNEHPALRKLLPTSMWSRQNKPIIEKVKQLRSINGKSIAAKRAMNKELARITGLHETDKINYDSKNILTMNNTSQAKRIEEYTSTVGLTIFERVDDFYKYKYTDAYERAFNSLENIDPEVRSVNISTGGEDGKGLLSKIVKEARDEVFTEDPTYMKNVERLIEPSVTEVVNKNINELTNFINSKGGDSTPKEILEKIKNTIKNKRKAELGDIKKAGEEVDVYDILDFMRTPKAKTIAGEQGFLFDTDIKIDIKNFQDLRKLTHDYERKYYSKKQFDTGASDPRYSTFRKISDLFDNSFESYLQYVEKYGDNQKVISMDGKPVMGKYQELANNIRTAEKDYKLFYRDRQRKSPMYQEFLKFSSRVDESYYPENMEDAAKAAMKYDKKDIWVPSGMINGQYPNSRVRNNNMLAGQFWDRMLERFNTRDSFLGELETFLGDPVMKDGKFTGRYELPKYGSEKYTTLEHMIETFNHYISAKQASAIDKVVLSKGGKYNQGYFKDKTREFLNADFDNLSVEGVNKFVKSMGAGELVHELAGQGDFLTLIKGIDEGLQSRTGGAFHLRGADMYKNVLTASKLSEEILEQTTEAVTSIMKEVKKSEPEFAKLRAEISQLARLSSKMTEDGLSIYNAGEFYEYALKTYNPNTKKSEFIEKVIEVSKQFYKGDEKKARESVANILAVGFKHQYTKPGAIQTNVDPQHRIDQLKDRLATATNKKEKEMIEGQIDIEQNMQSAIEKGLGFDRNKDKFAPYFEQNYYVDGDGALKGLVDNRDFISKYIGKSNDKRHKKMVVIFRMSILARQGGKEVAQALNMVDPTHGNTKFAFNTAMSRIAAVYSGRASIRYPMAEMSFALMQKQEAEAVAALLKADDKLIDLVYNTMITGKVDPTLYDNKMVESFLIDQMQLSKNVIRGWVDAGDNITEEGWERDRLLGIPPELTGQNKFFPAEKDFSSMMTPDLAQPMATNPRKKQTKTYRRLVLEHVDKMMQGDDKLRFYGALEQVADKFKQQPKELIQQQMKDLLRREENEKQRRNTR